MDSTARLPFRSRASWRIAIATTLVVAMSVASSGCAREATIPERLDDTTFWQLVNDLSEPDGYFHSDNFVSNELGFQYVIPEMLSAVGSGGVGR